MEAEQFDFSVVFPNIAAQLRSVLGNLHLAAAQLAPAIRREGDPALDSTASLLDQSYYRLLRLVNNLSLAAFRSSAGSFSRASAGANWMEARRRLPRTPRACAAMFGSRAARSFSPMKNSFPVAVEPKIRNYFAQTGCHM